MIKTCSIFIFILILITTLQCHYSCATCSQSSYSSCTTCHNNRKIIKAEGYQNNIIGICTYHSISNTNIFGIFFVMIVIAACIVFSKEQIIHFAVLIQALELLYIVEVQWSIETHYVLSAFSYLMAFTKINYLTIPFSGNIEPFKFKIFFKTTEITRNLSILGIVNLVLVVLMILIPTFKVIRKKFNKQRVQCLPDSTLSKIIVYINFAYFMMIQETILNIYFGMKFGQMKASDQAIVAIYLLSLIFFVINNWFYPFSFFRSKSAQFNVILLKIFVPIFILSPTDIHFLIFVYLIAFLSIDIILTNKNRNNSAINRLLLYKLYGLLIIILMAIFYGLQIGYNNQNISYMIGIFTTLSLCGLINIFIIEIFIQYKDNFCKNQQKKKTSLAIEITMDELTAPNKRIQKIQQYNFTCFPPQRTSNQDQSQKGDTIIIPLNLVPKNRQNDSINGNGPAQSNTSKISEKGSSNRQMESLDMNFPIQQNIGTFQEIRIQSKQKQIIEVIESQIKVAHNKDYGKPPSKRKGKKRKREQ